MRFLSFVSIALIALVGSGCSIRGMAVASLADTLAAGGDVFASDDDPELIRAAVPFALKTYESLLAETPRHRDLLVATARGFTQYAYGFIQRDAELEEVDDLAAGLSIRRRVRRLLIRGRDFALRALELNHEGLGDALKRGDLAGVAMLRVDEAPAAFWCAASWGAAISVLKDDADLIGDLPVVEALLAKVIELDPGLDQGSAHVVMMSLEAGLSGGNLENAEQHFTEAIRWSDGKSAAPYVTFAETLAVTRQDRALFRTHLQKALAIDPNAVKGLRLSNVLAQERAAWLLDRADELFVE